MSLTFPKDNKLVIGMDLDDVLADFIKKFMEVAAAKYGVDPNIRPTSWEWDDCDMSAERVDGTWSEIFQIENFWETLDVIPGVDSKLIWELNRKTKLYFPTARAVVKGRDIGYQSARWLSNLFCIRYPTVIIGNSKGPLANALAYDYFIDDRPKNCLEVKLARPECKVFLNNASHNQSFDLADKGISRIAHVNDFVKLVLA